MTMRRRFFMAGAVSVACPGARSAAAHAFLQRADPPVGGTVTGAPREIRLWFSEPLEPRFSGADVTTASGDKVETTSVRLDDADHRQLVIDVPPLKPGSYRVRWHVVSVDSHRTEGSFTFQVNP
jgi:methionine-rich copper-binding protein CopC